MHDLTFIFDTEFGSQLVGVTAEHTGKVGGVEVDQTPCDWPATGSDQVDGLAGHEVTDDPRDTCRQQRRVALGDCADRTRVQMQFAA